MTDMETPTPTRQLVKEKSVTMEYFLETSHLDKQTAELLRQYDKDGDGSFSKDEVVAIILDLREAMQSNEVLYSSNKLFKRLLTAAVAFCVLLLTSMFGLSYAVAVMTAKMDVGSDGSLVASGTGMIVATDSRANVFPIYPDETGLACVSEEEKNQIMADVFSGKNLLLQNHFNNSETVLQLNADGADVVNDFPCFSRADGTLLCLVPDEDCSPSRRGLSQGSRQLQDGGISVDLCPCFECECAVLGSGDYTGCKSSPCRRRTSEGLTLRERRERGY